MLGIGEQPWQYLRSCLSLDVRSSGLIFEPKLINSHTAALAPVVSGYINVGGASWKWLFWTLAIFVGISNPDVTKVLTSS